MYRNSLSLVKERFPDFRGKKTYNIKDSFFVEETVFLIDMYL